MKSTKSVVVDSLRIGRWLLTVSEANEAFVIKDIKSEEGKRYAFPVGGHSDMYTTGTGGAIGAKSIVFPTRWSIGEESVSYLVFRDRGVPGVDYRYAMSASRYRDL